MMMRPMRRRLSVLALAIAAIGTAPAAFAQTASPPADQDHRAHHPDAAAPAKPGAPATPPMQQGDKSMGMMGQGGMMCGDMKRDMKSMMGMMHDMMGMMSMHSGMMPPQADSTLASLKTDLKITEAQAPLWDRFAEVWRSASTVLKGQHKEMMASGEGTLPARLARREAMLSGHLASLKSVEEALAPLYASFSDGQKRIADKAIAFPMGMM